MFLYFTQQEGQFFFKFVGGILNQTTLNELKNKTGRNLKVLIK